MQISEQLTQSASSRTHPIDDRMLILNSAQDLRVWGSDDYKGGLWEDAMSQDIAADLNALSNDAIQSVSGQLISINSDSSITLPKHFQSTLPSNAIAFIENLSFHFNQAGEWPAEFLIQTNLGLHQISKGFHLDSKTADTPRQFRAFINISNDPTDQHHETEWIAGNGLDHSHMRLLTGQHAQTPLNDLPDPIKSNALVVKSRDMFLTKGLGDGTYRNRLHDGPMHRSPPHKNNYPEQGKRRTALLWQRHIEEPYADMA